MYDFIMYNIMLHVLLLLCVLTLYGTIIWPLSLYMGVLAANSLDCIRHQLLLEEHIIFFYDYLLLVDYEAINPYWSLPISPQTTKA